MVTARELRLPIRPLRWSPFAPVLQELLAEFEAVFLVGGVVRDAFWGYPAHDFDLAVPDHAFAVARKIANHFDGAFYKLDRERETGRALVNYQGQPITVDVARFRGEHLLADLQGRDFTLNAVAVPLVSDLSQVFDPLNGLIDAQARILRRCSPDSIASDPVRALRAVRMSLRFGLRIEPDTRADIRQYGPGLVRISPERVRDEFMALLGGRQQATAIRILDILGLLRLIIPEVDLLPRAPGGNERWERVLRTIDRQDAILQTIGPDRTDRTAAQVGLGMIVYYLDRHRSHLQEHLAVGWPNGRSHAALLTLAALLRECVEAAAEQAPPLPGQPDSLHLIEKRATALRLSRPEIDRLIAVIRHFGRLQPLLEGATPSRRDVYRFWRDCGPAGGDICLLGMAAALADAGPALDAQQWSRILQAIDILLAGAFESGERNVTNLPLLVTGKDLMHTLHLRSGPQIGRLLEEIREAQAAGEIRTTEEAIALARELLS